MHLMKVIFVIVMIVIQQLILEFWHHVTNFLLLNLLTADQIIDIVLFIIHLAILFALVNEDSTLVILLMLISFLKLLLPDRK